MQRRFGERGQEQARAFGTVPVPGTRIGAVVSLGLVVIYWIALPLARPFILGTSGWD
ncbi:MAG: hypothetical protein ACRD36_02230 [Candidatus Acidiferrum sp.]